MDSPENPTCMLEGGKLRTVLTGCRSSCLPKNHMLVYPSEHSLLLRATGIISNGTHQQGTDVRTGPSIRTHLTERVLVVRLVRQASEVEIYRRYLSSQ